MLDETPATTLGSVLTRLNDALEKGDAAAAAALFQADSYWRDLVAFTWNLRTMEGPEQIRAMLESQLAQIEPGSLRLDPDETPTASGDVTEGWIEFETAAGRGYGHIRVRDGLVWTLLTTMAELKGHEERLGRSRPLGIPDAPRKGIRTWREQREAEAILQLGRERRRERHAELGNEAEQRRPDDLVAPGRAARRAQVLHPALLLGQQLFERHRGDRLGQCARLFVAIADDGFIAGLARPIGLEAGDEVEQKRRAWGHVGGHGSLR